MITQFFKTLPIASCLILAACSAGTQRRTVEYGTTMQLTAGGYVSSNPFVGELRENGNGQTFVPKHIGTCIVSHPHLANGCYEITVEGGSEPFPDFDVKLGTKKSVFLSRHGLAAEWSTFPIIRKPYENSITKYTYSFTGELLSEAKVEFKMSTLKDDSGSTPEEILDRYLNEHFAPSATEPGIWYNAYTPADATEIAVVKQEKYTTTLTISVR